MASIAEQIKAANIARSGLDNNATQVKKTEPTKTKRTSNVLDDSLYRTQNQPKPTTASGQLSGSQLDRGFIGGDGSSSGSQKTAQPQTITPAVESATPTPEDTKEATIRQAETLASSLFTEDGQLQAITEAEELLGNTVTDFTKQMQQFLNESYKNTTLNIEKLFNETVNTQQLKELEQNAIAVKEDIENINSQIRATEDEVRAELGPSATESQIQRQVGSRIKDLNKRKDFLLDEYNAVQSTFQAEQARADQLFNIRLQQEQFDIQRKDQLVQQQLGMSMEAFNQQMNFALRGLDRAEKEYWNEKQFEDQIKLMKLQDTQRKDYMKFELKYKSMFAQNDPEIDIIELDDGRKISYDKTNNKIVRDFSNVSTIDFIKSKEGFRSEAYLDSAGVWTVGYGFTSIDGRPVREGDTISRDEADVMLESEVSRYQNFQNFVTRELTPEQEMALNSFEYNLGRNIWNSTGSGIIEAINRGDFEGAANIMLQHNKARDPATGELKVLRGLTNRRQEEAALLTAQPKISDDDWDIALDLNKQFNSRDEIKDFKDVYVAYNKIGNNIGLGTAAGDMSAIFAFMKILDPGSTVREGEFANAQNSTNVPGTVLNLYNKARAGTRLNEQQRQDFINAADATLEAQRSTAISTVNEFIGLAEVARIDPDIVIGKDLYNFINNVGSVDDLVAKELASEQSSSNPIDVESIIGRDLEIRKVTPNLAPFAI